MPAERQGRPARLGEIAREVCGRAATLPRVPTGFTEVVVLPEQGENRRPIDLR